MVYVELGSPDLHLTAEKRIRKSDPKPVGTAQLERRNAELKALLRQYEALRAAQVNSHNYLG